MTIRHLPGQAESSFQVDVLLSSYNGERYIEEQINSILAQSNRDWRILIRDDGSSDRTREICLKYQQQHPDQVIIIEDGRGNLGVVESFAQLLLHSTAPYVMFCDQDDVWLPEKIAIELDEIKRLETRAGNSPQTPIAVFTDALVVDSNLQPLSHSLLDYINRRKNLGHSLSRLCIEGNCYGCTMILNRALVRLVGQIPAGVISHDWWCGLVACAFGTLSFLDCTPIKHRRHSTNVSASKQSKWSRYLRDRPTLDRHRSWIKQVLDQCEIFARIYSANLPGESKLLYSDLCRVRHAGWFARRLLLLRHGVRMTGLGRNIAFFLTV
jgi:glycosyltransferase involved in cell wall biosynthesis